MSGSTCAAVINSIFLPYLIAGICGWIIFFFHADTKNRKRLFCIIAAVLLMFFWRFSKKIFPSARYGENLLVFFTLGSAFFLKYWDIFLKKSFFTGNALSWIKKTVIAIVLICLAIKFFHYNPYHDYNRQIAECIQKDISAPNSIIVSARSQYRYLPEIPQYVMPDFLQKNKSQKELLFLCIRQYQFMADRLYLVLENPLDFFVLPDDELKKITNLGSFQKNRKGKRAYLFRYDSKPVTESLTINTIPVPPDNNNLLKNGGFEKQYTFSGEKSYYSKIMKSPKAGVIPAGKSFPEWWDIYWGTGFEYGTVAAIYSSPQNAISGQYSLKAQSNKTVSILYISPFNARKYLFQCDIRPSIACSFGIQLSLRDRNNVFYGVREIKRARMDQANQLYHYEIQLTEEMLEPFQNFYLYLIFYDQCDVLIDNVSLTAMTKGYLNLFGIN